MEQQISLLQFRHRVSAVVISACFAFAVKNIIIIIIITKRSNEKHTGRYNTVFPTLVCVFSYFSGKFWSSHIRYTLSILWFVLIALSQIAFPWSHSSVSSGFRGNPNRLMCPPRLCGAGSDVRRVCWHVGVSTLIPTLLFLSHLSAPDVVQGCRNVSPLLRGKVSKQRISRAERWWIDFEIQFGCGGDEPNSECVSLDATANFISYSTSQRDFFNG